jgi:hypothetical protein
MTQRINQHASVQGVSEAITRANATPLWFSSAQMLDTGSFTLVTSSANFFASSWMDAVRSQAFGGASETPSTSADTSPSSPKARRESESQRWCLKRGPRTTDRRRELSRWPSCAGELAGYTMPFNQGLKQDIDLGTAKKGTARMRPPTMAYPSGESATKSKISPVLPSLHTPVS